MPRAFPTRRTLLGLGTTALGWLSTRVASTAPPNGSLPDFDASRTDDVGQLADEVVVIADRQRRRGVSLRMFGFVGDGVVDDTVAWRRAIAFAGKQRIREITVPAGVSLVHGSIVDAANPLPPGLAFVGEGAAVDDLYAVESRLRYAGKGICWDVSYPTGGPASVGRWAWTALTLECVDPIGTMFSFGDPVDHRPDDDPARDPYRFIQGVAFHSVIALGAEGSGDFLRACKTFELAVDAQCAVYRFRRAFWLKGCDNCVICARMVGNNRAVMIERSGSFGNNNRIDIRYVGAAGRPFGGEAAYSIWDNGQSTVIGPGTLLEGIGPSAHLYLAGYGTAIHSPLLGARAPFFELTPEAREIVVYLPRCTIVEQANTPIVHPPANPNFGNPPSDHRIRILDAPQTIRAILPDHPRLLLLDHAGRSARGTQDGASLLIGTHGVQPRSHVCTALNYWGRLGSPGGGGIKGFVQDSTNADLWVIRLTRDEPIEQGIILELTVGTDIQPGVYRLINRMRLASGQSNAGWALIATYDGRFLSNDFSFATASTYVTHNDQLDLSTVQRGKTVSINLYNTSAGRTGVDLFVEAIGVYAVPETDIAVDSSQLQALNLAVREAARRIAALEQALRQSGGAG